VSGSRRDRDGEPKPEQQAKVDTYRPPAAGSDPYSDPYSDLTVQRSIPEEVLLAAGARAKASAKPAESPVAKDTAEKKPGAAPQTSPSKPAPMNAAKAIAAFLVSQRPAPVQAQPKQASVPRAPEKASPPDPPPYVDGAPKYAPEDDDDDKETIMRPMPAEMLRFRVPLAKRSAPAEEPEAEAATSDDRRPDAEPASPEPTRAPAEPPAADPGSIAKPERALEKAPSPTDAEAELEALAMRDPPYRSALAMLIGLLAVVLFGVIVLPMLGFRGCW
jgi:hypothetical protein